MALDNVKKSLEQGKELCIWDPSPMCLGSGATSLTDRLVNKENKRAWERFDFANELHSEDKFYSNNNYETCKNWTNASQRARDGNALERNLDPRYKENTRFIIIAAGPTGSGKTKIENAIKNVVARTLNPKASNLPFQNLGHDENIKTDPIFIKQYKSIIPEGVSSNNITQEQISNVFSLYEEYKTNNSAISRIAKENEAIRLANTYIEKRQGDVFEIPPKSVFDKEPIAYDTYLYFQVCIAFYLGLNINYETTLKNPESIKFLTKAAGIFTNGCKRFDYVFILGFPIVELNQLEQRIQYRFDNRGEKIEFLDMLIDNKLLDNMEKSYKFIAGIIENCTGRVDVRTICGKNGKIGIDYLALFDNTKKCVYEEKRGETVAMSCDPEKMPKLDVLPISERSYILLKGGRYKNPATRLQLQIPQKKTLIALLMTNLNRAISYKSGGPGKKALSLDCSDTCDTQSSYCLSPTTKAKSCVNSMKFDESVEDAMSEFCNTNCERVKEAQRTNDEQGCIYKSNILFREKCSSNCVPTGTKKICKKRGGKRKTRRKRKK